MDLERQERLNEVAAIGRRLESETRVPARVTVAIWATESGWGTEPVGKHNYFGIKRDKRHALCCSVDTHEEFTRGQIEAWNRKHPHNPARIEQELPDGKFRVALADQFADYSSLEAACQDFAWLISHSDPYAGAWRQYLADSDVDGLILRVAKTYSTAARYTALVTTIAGQSNVQRAIAEARA